MSRSHTSTFVRVEHLFIDADGNPLASWPVVVSDSRTVLHGLMESLTNVDRACFEWHIAGRCEPLAAWQEGAFNGAEGWRLRRQLRASVGTRWRWRNAVRSTVFGHVSGSAGRVDIPIDRVWLAQSPRALVPMQQAWLGDHSDGTHFGADNDGILAVDLSGSPMLATECAAARIARLLKQMLQMPALWTGLSANTGCCQMRIHDDEWEGADIRPPRSERSSTRTRSTPTIDVFCARTPLDWPTP